MAYAHSDPTATVLNSGDVLIAGGFGCDGSNVGCVQSGVEVYSSGTWTSTGSMTAARYAHSATLLDNGQVLVAGGISNMVLASAEFYNPATRTWTSGPAMNGGGRGYHTATLLNDGRVLVAGGVDGGWNTLQTAIVYNPGSNTWTPVPSMHSPRVYHTATLLGNGKVLVVGGYDGTSYLPHAETFDPGSNTWTQVDDMPTGIVASIV